MCFDWMKMTPNKALLANYNISLIPNYATKFSQMQPCEFTIILESNCI